MKENFPFWGGLAIILLIYSIIGAEAKNQCGGLKTLTGQIGDACQIEPPIDGCNKGLVQCLGRNDLTCSPNCNTAIVKNEIECGDNGYLNKAKTECICQPGFKGSFCDEVDFCFNVNCGIHGVCTSNGACKCDTGFFGKRCEINSICEPGGIWNAKTSACKCKTGYVGEHCMQCSNETLCVPNKKGKVDVKTYDLGFYNTDLKAALLTKELPPDYTYGPVIPGTESLDCGCNIKQETAPEGQFFEWGTNLMDFDSDTLINRRHNDDDSDEEEYGSMFGCPRNEWDGFVGDFHDHHFEPRGSHTHAYWIGAFGWFLLITVGFLFCCCFVNYSDGYYINPYYSPRTLSSTSSSISIKDTPSSQSSQIQTTTTSQSPNWIYP